MKPIQLIQRKIKAGLSDTQLLVMLALGENTMLRLVDLAEACELVPSTVSKILHDLQFRHGPEPLVECDRPQKKFGKCEPAFFWLSEAGETTLARVLSK